MPDDGLTDKTPDYDQIYGASAVKFSRGGAQNGKGSYVLLLTVELMTYTSRATTYRGCVPSKGIPLWRPLWRTPWWVVRAECLCFGSSVCPAGTKGVKRCGPTWWKTGLDVVAAPAADG